MARYHPQMKVTGEPAFHINIYSKEDSPIKVKAARSAGREYIALLRDARSLGQGDETFDQDANFLEEHLDYLDDEFPV